MFVDDTTFINAKENANLLINSHMGHVKMFRL